MKNSEHGRNAGAGSPKFQNAQSGDQLAAVERRLEMKRLATIKEVQISLHDLESVGFHRVDR